MIGERRIPARCLNMVKTKFPKVRVARDAFVAAMLLSGCASASDTWIRAGADAAATSQAYQDCQAVAHAAVAPEIAIDKDIVATRGGDWQRADVFSQQTGMMQSGITSRTAAIIDSCMQAKGFAPAK